MKRCVTIVTGRDKMILLKLKRLETLFSGAYTFALTFTCVSKHMYGLPNGFAHFNDIKKYFVHRV